ncbi:MAG: Gfo/Idh/MocA family oxidoreductase [Planctomycetota bacterium]
MSSPLKCAMIGCGNVADRYAAQTKEHAPDDAVILGYADMDAARAQQFAEKFGGKVYADLDAILADDDVELLINLTIHHAHYEVIKKALEGGKHVYTEKPIALKYAEAKELVELAEARGLTLAGAPITFLGDAQSAAWKAATDGTVGTPRVIYAENNHGRIEAWHPNPGPFYGVGPLWDVAVYPLTLATTFYGPAARVLTSVQRVVYPERKNQAGESFTIETPEFTTAVIELASGPLVRLTSNFYVHNANTDQKGKFEVHGDAGSVVLGDFQASQTSVAASAFGQPREALAYPNDPPFEGIPFYRGIVEVARAMREGRPSRVTGAQAAHVVEILEAITASAAEGRSVELTSTFERPAPPA